MTGRTMQRSGRRYVAPRTQSIGARPFDGNSGLVQPQRWLQRSAPRRSVRVWRSTRRCRRQCLFPSQHRRQMPSQLPPRLAIESPHSGATIACSRSQAPRAMRWLNISQREFLRRTAAGTYLLRRHPHELDPGPCLADVDDSESWVVVTSERRTESDRSEGDARG